MGRGQGKATDLGNNGAECAPWTWMFDPRSGAWVSNRHEYTIIPTGLYFRVATERGMWIVGPKGRVRQFKCIFKAQMAADAVAFGEDA